MALEGILSRKYVSRLFVVAGAFWLVGVGLGLRASLNYEGTASAPASPQNQWPRESKIPRTPGLPTIVVMAHPHCPCTRATIGELSLLMTRVHNQATAAVVFVRPPGVPVNWELTDLWQDAKRIPGVTVMKDEGGEEAALFGALASGQTMLYDAQGKLEFSGGITAGRGHAGDNAGRSTIVELVTQGHSEIATTPVYGCALGNRRTREDETK